MKPYILSIATGAPATRLTQEDAASFVASLPDHQKTSSRVKAIYENTRIKERHLAYSLLSPEAMTFLKEHGTISQRMAMYREHAIPLAERVAREAIERAGVSPEEITQLVFVTSTGFTAPGIDAALIERLGLRRDTSRNPVTFMGCAAAMVALRTACDHVLARKSRMSLVVCLELSSLNATLEDDLNDVIIHSIFGDGCAAVVVGALPEKEIPKGTLHIVDMLTHLSEGTSDGIVLGIQDKGITCTLSRSLPDYIAGLRPVMESFLDRNGMTAAQIGRWAIHPGGTRILGSVQKCLELSDTDIAHSWEVLGEYGNTLSCAVLFVLERMLYVTSQEDLADTGIELTRQESPSGEKASSPFTIALSFSPGVGVEGLLLKFT
jgi:alpha-pyrone synthase